MKNLQTPFRLADLIANKRIEVAERQHRCSLESLRRDVKSAEIAPILAA